MWKGTEIDLIHRFVVFGVRQDLREGVEFADARLHDNMITWDQSLCVGDDLSQVFQLL